MCFRYIRKNRGTRRDFNETGEENNTFRPRDRVVGAEGTILISAEQADNRKGCNTMII